MKIFIFEKKRMIEHPGKLLATYLNQKGWTQKAFSLHIGKKVSEINELIKGKRNITIARDMIFSQVFQTPQKFWILKQIDYDYQQVVDKEKYLVNGNFQVQESKNNEKYLEKKPSSETMTPEKVPEEFLITKVFESF